MTNFSVHFPLQEKTIEAPQGVSLAQAAALAGFPLNLVCGGRGSCGKCGVEIRDSRGRRRVLACRTPVEEPLEIFLQDADYRQQANILTGGSAGRQRRFDPAITKAYWSADKLQPAYCGGYTELEDPLLLKKLGMILAGEDYSGLTFIQENGRILDIQNGDTSGLLYGAACDIGTTSVALYIYDLTDGRLLKTCSALNRQISHGADVISRISFCVQDSGGTAELQKLIVDTINGLLAEAAGEVPELRENLYSLVFCGNTAMQHFLFGFYPGALGHSPFASLSMAAQRCFGREIGLTVPKRCPLVFLPLLGGFVGADITSVLLTIPEEEKLRLVIDLGTNGEIVLGRGGRLLAASTACGPALEGSNLSCGMRGTKGAVERFAIREGKVSYRVIGDGPAAGICGSGIVDLTAALLLADLMDPTGRLLRREEYQKLHPGSALADRLADHEGTAAFYLTDRVFLDQKDIRQIQLAKSAICAGCLALLAAYGVRLEEVDQLVLAGAFGNHIDVAAALAIGLLPPLAPEKVLPIGNGAGQGAGLFLLDRSLAEKTGAIAAATEHCELACDPVFMEQYILQMNFPDQQ